MDFLAWFFDFSLQFSAFLLFVGDLLPFIFQLTTEFYISTYHIFSF